MRIGKIGVVIIGLVPFNVYGECTPTPDCADMGYTETSCSGKFVRCPFDTSKLFCAPCDSKFQYTCSGDNITGGIGSACGGKYVSCECSSTDYIFSNGACVCDTSCKVGAIYYSDGSCSSCVDSTKTAIGVVVKDNELVMSQVIASDMTWGIFDADINNLPNILTLDEVKNDYLGKNNTQILVEEQTLSGLTSVDSTAILCDTYKTEGTNVGDWYLPAAGELYSYMHKNYDEINATIMLLNWSWGDNVFWSSSENSSLFAWFVTSVYGNVTNTGKHNPHSVACFLYM